MLANARYSTERGQFPAHSLSWTEAVAFCDALSAHEEEKRAGRTYRLPTEAEWEYACRPAPRRCTPSGTAASLDQANLEAEFPAPQIPPPPKGTARLAVGTYVPNAWGLYDMHGNVYRVVPDWYDPDYYEKAPPRDPPWPEGESDAGQPDTSAPGRRLSGESDVRSIGLSLHERPA